jgi:hypothetical protein
VFASSSTHAFWTPCQHSNIFAKENLQKYNESNGEAVLTFSLAIHAVAGKLFQFCLVKAALTKNALTTPGR